MAHVKRSPADLKQRITRQKSNFIFDNSKNLVLDSIKIYADKKEYKDSVKLSPKELEALKKIKKGDVATFRKALYHLTRPDRLAIDSESQALKLCKHARARQHVFNPVARAIGRDDLVVEYGKKSEVKKPQTTKKAEKKKAKTAPKKQAKRK